MAGIYIHIPFCKQKCSYCDFYFSTRYHSYEDELVTSLVKELQLRKNEFENSLVESIYFGGGTPSLLKQEQLAMIVDEIYSSYQVSSKAEITLEANPDDITENKLLMWRKNHINRLSIGIQSFDQEDLDWMKRAHDSEQSLNAVKEAQKLGFGNISIDLIYGLPNMSNERWLKQIEKAISLNVQHISAYCLTVEEKTELSHLVKKKTLIVANNEQQSEHFTTLQQTLKANDFVQYEISNFGKEGYFSQHNSSYWKQKPYLGIGPSAHSFNLKQRSWNIANSHQYISSLTANELPTNYEELSTQDNFNELLLTGLRTIWGVDLNQLEKLQSLNKEQQTYIKELLANGEAEIKNNCLTLTEIGFLLADKIASDLFLID